MLRTLVRRTRTIEADHDRAVRFYSANVRGFAQLPVTVDGPLMGKYAPARAATRRRHRCVVRHRRGDRARAGLAPGFPVALGARRVERCEEVAAKIRADGARGGRAPARPPATPTRSARSPRRSPPTSATSRSSSRNAGAVAPGVVHEVDSERFAARDRPQPGRSPSAGARLRAGHGRAAPRRRRASSPPTSRSGSRPFTAAYAAGKWGLEGMVQAMQMELEGTGVRASVVRPGPTWSEMGSDWDDAGRRRCAEPVGALRPRTTPALPQAGRHCRRDHDRGVCSARRAPEPRRGLAPKHRWRTHDPVEHRGGVPPVCRLTPYGHLEDLRTDPVGLLQRVREECGDVGRFRLADRDVVLVSGASANEAFFRAPDDVLDQAEAYPFMTPIFGKGVVFDATPEERQQMLKNQALRGEHDARPRRDHRARDPTAWSPTGATKGEIDLLDWFAELTIYTTSACLIGRPLPRGARRAVRAALPRPRAWHRRAGVRRPVRRHRVLPPPRRRPRASWSSWCRRSSTAGSSGGRCPSEERDLLDVLISLEMTRRLHHRHLHLDDVRRATTRPPGTAAWTMIELLAPPGGDEGRGRRARRPVRRRVELSPSRRCARSRASRRP